MKFTKMHGIGNDYVYVNCLSEELENPEKVARFVSDRHFGIGSDGLILIKPSKIADFEMAMYNADGSRGEMCGNGVRCVAKYVYDYGLTGKTTISIETLAGIKYLELSLKDNKVETVKVNMGSPILKAAKVPIISEQEEVINEDIEVEGKSYKITGVSMGNPHAITFVEDVQAIEIEKIGPKFENHKRFPQRVNTEFIQLVNRKYIKMRVWERGSGETLACGTGACASVVACVVNGYTENEVTVELLGGKLTICWDRDENIVYMTGSATTVFDGEIDISDLK